MRIAHISDLHITENSEFKNKVFERGQKAVNTLDPQPDLVFISGDITWDGILSEYELALEKIKGFSGTTMLIPGNHDSRHLGYRIFEEFFGSLEFFKVVEKTQVMGLDSSEPDLDEGHIGRKKYNWIEGNLRDVNGIKIVGFHHHLLPVPNAGREKNILNDAGEVLDLILRNSVALVLMGHRHVPYAVRVHNTLMVNAGAFSSSRTRAHLGNSFNIIDCHEQSISVSTYGIEKEKLKLMVEFDWGKEVYMNRFYTQP
ncbi:MAG: metallophosphoesterase [Thermoplasmata archaeon]|nr:MAG: metallophosphoesterase [Thermoplasmata archaeon]